MDRKIDMMVSFAALTKRGLMIWSLSLSLGIDWMLVNLLIPISQLTAMH